MGIYTCLLRSTANATLFYMLSSSKSVNYLGVGGGGVVLDYHLNDPSIFLVRIRGYSPRGTKYFFRASRARARDFSKPCTH